MSARKHALHVTALKHYSGHETPVSSPFVNEKGIVVSYADLMRPQHTLLFLLSSPLMHRSNLLNTGCLSSLHTLMEEAVIRCTRLTG
jgi:hypothetical protein